MTWEQGRSVLDAMLTRGTLQRVPPSREHADRLLTQARGHLKSAEAVASLDPTGAYQLLYDATRKALGAVLENQGLRATSRGGHVAVVAAITAQHDPPHGAVVRPVDRMRRRRNEAEYPSEDSPGVTSEEVSRDLTKAGQVIDLAARLLDAMGRY